MNEQQEEAYSEALDEIERLLDLNDSLIADKNRITEVAKKAITLRDAEIALLGPEIARTRELLLRAADALDYQRRFINEHCCDGWPSCTDLIIELRKAAQCAIVSAKLSG